jgi:hypothetical protein
VYSSKNINEEITSDITVAGLEYIRCLVGELSLNLSQRLEISVYLFT